MRYLDEPRENRRSIVAATLGMASGLSLNSYIWAARSHRM